MQIRNLQQYLSATIQLLTESGSKNLADEMQQLVDGLDSCKELTIKEFADFLNRAKQYDETGIVPAKAKATRRTATVDPELVTRTALEVMDLYERAIDESLSYAAIETEIAKLNKHSTAVVKAVAKEVGVAGAKSKKAAIEAINRKISKRKESFQRTSF